MPGWSGHVLTIFFEKKIKFSFEEVNFLYFRALNIDVCRFLDMKRAIVFLVFILALIIDLKAQMVEDVDAVKFRDLISKGNMILLDVRTPGEYSRGHIQGSTAINIADRDFASKVSMLQKDKTILIYCLTGSRSSAGAAYMSRMGFTKIYNLQRGIMDWSRQGFPVEQSGETVASSGTTYTQQSFDKLLKDHKLVLVDFHAVWCAPCKAMSPVVDKVTAEFKGKAKVEKVDVENNKAITTAYQVQTIPGFVLFKDGKKVWSYNGVISYDDLSGVIKKYL